MSYAEKLKSILKRTNGRNKLERNEYVRHYLEEFGGTTPSFYAFNFGCMALGLVSRKRENGKIFFELNKEKINSGGEGK